MLVVVIGCWWWRLPASELAALVLRVQLARVMNSFLERIPYIDQCQELVEKTHVQPVPAAEHAIVGAHDDAHPAGKL